MEINKDRHEVLIRCLEELYQHTTDESERQWVLGNIRLMTKLYERYFRLREEIRRDTLLYTEAFEEIRPASYKLLRKKQIAERELFIKQEKEKERVLRRSTAFPSATNSNGRRKIEQKKNPATTPSPSDSDGSLLVPLPYDANLKDRSPVQKTESKGVDEIIS